MKNALTGFIVLFILSCSDHKPTQKELEKTLRSSPYDSNLMHKLPDLEAIANIIKSNLDTVISSGRDFYCNYYLKKSVAQGTNIRDLPDFVFKKIDSLWQHVDNENLMSLEVCFDKRITITARFELLPDNIARRHLFLWNRTPKDLHASLGLTKDTLLNNNCYYIIDINQNYSGW
jgi:hypothetical protein